MRYVCEKFGGDFEVRKSALPVDPFDLDWGRVTPSIVVGNTVDFAVAHNIVDPENRRRAVRFMSARMRYFDRFTQSNS